MRILILSLLVLFSLNLVHCKTDLKVIPVRDPNNITLALGSCLNTYKGSEDMDIALRAAINTDPDLWMWIGDAVYLDGHTFLLGTMPGPGYEISDDEYTESVYNQLKEHPTYQELRKKVPIIGTWDDHDYAYDNTDKTFKHKDRNMKIYLDFIDEPADSPRRKQKGIYQSYYIGDEKKIKVILFDIRYNSDPESKANNVIDTDTTKAFDDMLGDEQWEWIDNELKDETPLYTILISGTQFIPDDRPVIQNWYINSREKLFDMIVANKKSGIILISGDVHYAEILKHDCPSRVGYKELHEFTTSGMTHSAKEADIFDGIVPKKFSHKEDRYFDKNIAVLRLVNKEGVEHPDIVFEALDLQGNVVLRREVPYEEVTFNQTLADNYRPCEDAATKVKGVAREITTEVLEAIRSVYNKVADL